MIYPLRFEPIYKERIWGGRTLAERFARQLPENKIGESWDISCHDNGMSVISNGPLKGIRLEDAINKFGKDLLGTEGLTAAGGKFPLLIKLLDANDDLSVQVHPDDSYASLHENGELGKTEMWYVLYAKPGARIVYGLRYGVDRQEFREAIDNKRVEDCLEFTEVNAGDVFDVPAGLVHALGAGVVVAEVQQNSDTVYRVYDWNRLDDRGKPRELHVDKALDVINFEAGSQPKKKNAANIMPNEITSMERIVENSHFVVELISLKGSSWKENMTGERFYIFTCVEGNFSLLHESGEQTLSLGDSILLPANSGECSLNGSGKLLKSFVS